MSAVMCLLFDNKQSKAHRSALMQSFAMLIITFAYLLISVVLSQTPADTAIYGASASRGVSVCSPAIAGTQ